MIIFLSGEDTYRAKQKLKEIISQYKKVHKSGLNLKFIDCRESQTDNVFNNLKDEIRQVSIFKEKKLLVLTNAFANADFKERFLKDSKSFLNSEDIIVFYEEKEIDKRNSLFKFLKDKARCQEFIQLSGQRLKKWINEEFAEYKGQIDSDALELLINYVGSDLWRLDNEIKKIVNFANSRAIEKKDIKLLVKPKIEIDIFKTIDAASQKDKKQALRLLQNHLEKGDSPLYLLAMINFQFRNLLLIRDLLDKGIAYNIISKKTGLHPFVIRKSYYQCQKFSLEELKKIYQKIFQADLDIKTGKINPAIALDLLIAQI